MRFDKTQANEGSTKLPKGLRWAKIGFGRSRCEFRVGASWVKGNIIVIGYNIDKTSPALIELDYKYPVSIHAEVSLFSYMPPIANVGGRVFVYRATKQNRLALAKPCRYCMDMLIRYRVKQVCYTIDDGWETLKL